MGDTHHWYRIPELNPKKFFVVADECKRVLERWQATASDGSPCSDAMVAQRLGAVMLTSECLFIEGTVEHFKLPRVFAEMRPLRDGKYHQSCKTHRQPYDLVVMACLLVCKHHFKKDFKLSSNYLIAEWKPAIELVNTTLGWRSDWYIAEQEVDGLMDTWFVEKPRRKARLLLDAKKVEAVLARETSVVAGEDVPALMETLKKEAVHGQG
jgi:hypothetical protein